MGELGKGERPHLSAVLDGPWFTLPFADILQSYSAKMYAYFCFYINIIYIHIYIKQVIYRESSICLCDDKKKRNLAENKINVLLSDIMWLCAGVLVRRNRRLELNFVDCKVDRPEEKKKKLLICSGYDTSSWPCAVFPN